MARTKRTSDPRIYQLKVTLKDSRPPIWRTIQVTSGTTLYKLHLILQAVMRWDDYHLHLFTIGDADYGEPDDEEDFRPIGDDRRVKLAQVVFREKSRFTYTYDFGDGWEHDIFVEKFLPPQGRLRYPVYVDGERACPPEDCGGIGGYEDFLRAIRNPKHPEHKELLTWAGGSFDSEAFELTAVNRLLREIR